jgi:beta-lactamase regulating signal transducer with metallopeptidase domain
MVEELGPEGLEAILLHELAHISRADYLINIFQSAIETLLFFNPFVWRMSSVIRREREHCCDDLVVAFTEQPLAYARALSSLARQHAAPLPAIALAATGQQPLLFNRIKRIIEMKDHPPVYRAAAGEGRPEGSRAGSSTIRRIELQHRRDRQQRDAA